MTIEVVVIDPAEREAAAFVKRLRRRYTALKAIAAQGAGAEFTDTALTYDAVIRKPAHRTPEAADEWVRLIRAIAPSNDGEEHAAGS